MSRSNHKSTYSPPPRMLRQKNIKQSVESEKKKNIQSQTEVSVINALSKEMI